MSDIVLYEEDHLMRTLIQEWLCNEGYRVQVSAPGAKGPTAKGDLVIASISTPKRTGARLLHDIKFAHPGVPLIALSSQFRGGLCCAGATAQSLGVSRVIAKPLTRAALMDAVRAMIGPPN